MNVVENLLGVGVDVCKPHVEFDLLSPRLEWLLALTKHHMYGLAIAMSFVEQNLHTA